VSPSAGRLFNRPTVPIYPGILRSCQSS
jgi:hypothetical protein